jgi:hypothetical protein
MVVAYWHENLSRSVEVGMIIDECKHNVGILKNACTEPIRSSTAVTHENAGMMDGVWTSGVVFGDRTRRGQDIWGNLPLCCNGFTLCAIRSWMRLVFFFTVSYTRDNRIRARCSTGLYVGPVLSQSIRNLFRVPELSLMYFELLPQYGDVSSAGKARVV